ncbi:FAD-dependent oxidoreductase [Paenibacillus sp. S150]|uniref:FAD-dependent oxidoreductase n=1 Tax=Paenibacillus sp. S150 TaxID=2749826 RepID=UPI001C56F091|nr:FAD-dependent oxidoreductase [Paenibacillus sp. S150]
MIKDKKIRCLMVLLLVFLTILSGCQNDNTEPASNSSVKPGTYTATESGFGGDVTVNVTVEADGSVSAIDVNADNDTPTVGGAAAPKLAENIVEAQSLNVDAVSGASSTSKAVIAAVGTALAQAGVDVEAWKTKEVVKDGTDEDVTVDVVVVGAGGSGTGAALAAAETGASVMIIEKTAAVGGNTKLSSGFFAVNSDLQKAEGLNLSVDEAVNRLLEFNHYLSNGPLTRAIVGNSADTIKWLEGYGVEFYLQQETTQFAHEDDVYKYKSYHKYKDTTAAFENIYKHLDEMGADLRLNTSLKSIIQSKDGTVTGITATKEDGGTLTVNAKATIICTGGFGANTEKVSNVMNSAYLNSLGMPNNGEGLEMMEGLGAITWDATALLHAAQLAESTVAQSSGSEHMAGFSSSSLTQLLMSPLLWVDASGSRFVNEDVVYDTAYWANAAYAAGGKYYIVVDTATLKDYTAGTSMRISKAGPGANMEAEDFAALADQAVASGTAFKGSTIAELAEASGMDAKDLEANVSRYNQMVNNQKDTDYNKSNASLKYTVESGDLYAFDCRAVNLGTIGGVKVDEKLEVIDNDYNPIKGLYTAGTNAGGYYEGQGYPPYEGLASGFAWTSGRIAGESAATYAASSK